MSEAKSDECTVLWTACLPAQSFSLSPSSVKVSQRASDLQPHPVGAGDEKQRGWRGE